MIQIENTLISDDIIEKKFACNLKVCKGICCVKGDSGAPLEDDEIILLDKEYHKIEPFLRDEGRKAIAENGIYYIDSEHDTVTMLINDKECAFTLFDEKGIASCAIENAYFKGKTIFRKPMSCWLYPARTKKISDLYAVNYDVWDICRSAELFGEENNIPVYKFLKEPLIKKFGEEWYKQLEFYANNKSAERITLS
ncbi:MAG: DUF3109 family protein [Bacteroidales bacterium]|nr:DUF3109 family protein [Bacteroidales bacterium]